MKTNGYRVAQPILRGLYTHKVCQVKGIGVMVAQVVLGMAQDNQ